MAITTENSSQIFSAIRVVLFIMNSIAQDKADEMKSEITILLNKYKGDDVIYSIVRGCAGNENIF